jgi:hypothetical protein
MSNYLTLLKISQVLTPESLAAVASFSSLPHALKYLDKYNSDQHQLELITNDNCFYWIVPSTAASRLSWFGFERLVTLSYA